MQENFFSGCANSLFFTLKNLPFCSIKLIKSIAMFVVENDREVVRLLMVELLIKLLTRRKIITKVDDGDTGLFVFNIHF